ncbi:MAG: ATP-binding cassette domain-containing protein [Promethearchaeota archaeon]
MYAIKTEDLKKVFGNYTAIRDIDLEVPQGVCYGLLGLNGAGKTTTIKCILGLLRPTSGNIKIFGKKRTSETNRYIGFLPERIDYHGHIPVKDFLAYVGLLNLLPRSEIEKQIDELLEFVGLGGWGDSAIGNLSAGMRQRLGFAQALMGNPKLIMLDEPTANLDPVGRDEMLNKIKAIVKEGITVFISSHILSEIEMVSDYIGIIADGYVVTQGSVEDIKRERSRVEKPIIEIVVNEPTKLVLALENLDYISKITRMDFKILAETTDPDQLGKDIPQILVDNRLQLIKYSPPMGGLQEIFLKIMEETAHGKK